MLLMLLFFDRSTLQTAGQRMLNRFTGTQTSTKLMITGEIV